MAAVLAIVMFIGFFVLLSYLVGSLMQLFSNWTGRTINVKTAGSWTTFHPKNKQKSDLVLFNRQIEAATLGMSILDEQLYCLTGNKEIVKEYELLPRAVRSEIATALTFSEFPKSRVISLYDQSGWQRHYHKLYFKIIGIKYDAFSTLSTTEKEDIRLFIEHYQSETRKAQQSMQDKLMIEINFKKIDDKPELILLPASPTIEKIDVAFKDICLFLKNYPDEDKLVDVKSDGHFTIKVYYVKTGIFTRENEFTDKPTNYVAFNSENITFGEVTSMVKYAYKRMPQSFRSAFLYNVDFDKLIFQCKE